VLIFPYWDKTSGLNTILRITNTGGTPNFIDSAEDEELQLHIWFMNRNCQDQNYRIPFTAHDTQWVLISTKGKRGLNGTTVSTCRCMTMPTSSP